MPQTLDDFVDFNVFVKFPSNIYELSSLTYPKIQEIRRSRHVRGVFFNHYYSPPNWDPHVKYGFLLVEPTNLMTVNGFRNFLSTKFSHLIIKIDSLSPPPRVLRPEDLRMGIPVDYIKCWAHDLYQLTVSNPQVDYTNIHSVYHIVFKLINDKIALDTEQKKKVYHNLYDSFRQSLQRSIPYLSEEQRYEVSKLIKATPKLSFICRPTSEMLLETLKLGTLNQYTKTIAQAIKKIV